MKFSQNSFESDFDREYYLTPSEIIEHIYCARFSYFLHCLKIPQHEELRYKVLLGRDLHNTRKHLNRGYLRKKLGCIGKDIDVYMISSRYHLRGIVDEVLHLNDGTSAPMDYKFAVAPNAVYRTHKIQSILYGMMITDFYKTQVNRGFICYTRSRNKLMKIPFSNEDFKRADLIIKDIMYIIQHDRFPEKTKYMVRCKDCCYRNICA